MKFNKEKAKYLLKETTKDTIIAIPTAIAVVLIAFALYKLLLFIESCSSILLCIVMLIMLVFFILLLLNAIFLKIKE